MAPSSLDHRHHRGRPSVAGTLDNAYVDTPASRFDAPVNALEIKETSQTISRSYEEHRPIRTPFLLLLNLTIIIII